MNTNETLKCWLGAINNHDVAALARLMAENFLFVDSLGHRIEGALPTEAGWRRYFAMCPDYWIRADCMLIDGETVMICAKLEERLTARPGAHLLLGRRCAPTAT